MAEFFGFLKTFMVCGTLFFVATLILLALPQSRLRSVGLEIGRWAMVAGFLILTVSPADFIPDVIPGLGWGDDIAYVVGAVATARGALRERKKRALMDECELRELEARAKE